MSHEPETSRAHSVVSMAPVLKVALIGLVACGGATWNAIATPIPQPAPNGGAVWAPPEPTVAEEPPSEAPPPPAPAPAPEPPPAPAASAGKPAASAKAPAKAATSAAPAASAKK